MANKVENPSGQGPKKENPPKQLTSKEQAIEQAKKTVQKAAAKNEQARSEFIKTLRNQPLGELKDAKDSIKDMKNISWLIQSPDQIQHSLEVARYAENLAKNPELANDPMYLLAKTVELAYSARSDATTEARLEMAQAISKAKGRLNELLVTNTKYAQEINTNTFDEVVYGGELVASDKNLFKEDHPEEESIVDPEIVRLLQDIDRKIRTNPDYLRDTQGLDKDIEKLQQMLTGVGHATENQVGEAMKRLLKTKRDVETVIVKKQNDERERIQKEREGGRVIEYKQVENLVREEDRLTADELRRHPKPPHIFHHMSLENIQLVLSGEEGQREYFYKFISEIYTMGKSYDRADLPEVQEYNEFKTFMEWAHPKNTDYYLLPYTMIWKDIPKHYQVIKNFLFTPGDIKDKLKGLKYLTGGDLDLYAKGFVGSNYAIPLYEEVVRDVLADRRMKYSAAQRKLNGMGGEQVFLKEYRELFDLRKSGRLSVDREARFQELQQIVDDAGYGVMLWDSDIQNYAELDFEVNAMQHELDSLRLRQQETLGKGHDLSESELKRIKILEDEIKYKHKKSLDIQYDETDIHKVQSTDRGLSPIDKEVKERLRMVLEKRFKAEGRQLKEWELNMAVWAARQWTMGSGRLVSISAEMAIRPAFDLSSAGIDIGKYVMKAPAFEDIQRALNPDLFAHRFGVGGKAGAAFKAHMEISLLEAKKHTFKNSRAYVREDEKGLDPIVRKANEFIRQVQAESGVPYTEALLSGFLKTGGNFDASDWRAQIAALEQIRLKNDEMRRRGEIGADAQLDNQALGLQFNAKDAKGKMDVLDRMMKRTPSTILQLLGEDLDPIYERYGLGVGNEVKREKFRRALAAGQVDTWDVTGQVDESKRKLAYKTVDFVENAADVQNILGEYFKQENFTEAEIQGFHNFFREVKGVLDQKKETIVRAGLPMTLTLSDIDWKDAEMFQVGAVGVDRRLRDMEAQAAVRDAELAIMGNAQLMFNKDPKETLKQIKVFRDTMNNYTTPNDAEKATYEIMKAWLNMNRNRSINSENHRGTPMGKVIGVVDTALTWIPGYIGLKRGIGHMDVSRSPIIRIAQLKGRPDADGVKHRLIGDKLGEGIEHWMEAFPHKVAESVSYASRYAGAKGNAFDEHQIDEILDMAEGMGLFNVEEDLYHKLAREFHSGIGGQIRGAIRQYWLGLPMLAFAFGGKQAIDDEKKR